MISKRNYLFVNINIKISLVLDDAQNIDFSSTGQSLVRQGPIPCQCLFQALELIEKLKMVSIIVKIF